MSVKAAVEVKGIDEILRKLERMPRAFLNDSATAVYNVAEETLVQAKAIVPLRDGPLRDSGQVSSPRFGKDSVEVRVGFGGGDVHYAVRQHEELSYRHAPGRVAKYLEIPAMANAPKLPAAVMRALSGTFNAIR